MPCPPGRPGNATTRISTSSRVRLPVDMVRLVLNELNAQAKTGTFDDGDRMVLHELAMDIEALAAIALPSEELGFTEAEYIEDENESIRVSDSPMALPVAPAAPLPPIAELEEPPPDSIKASDVTDLSTNRAIVPSDADTAAGGPPANSDSPTVEQLQQALLDIFQELDLDSSGTIGAPELRRALNALHFPRARTTKLLNAADQSGDGFIDVREWRRVVEEGCSREGDFAKLAETVLKRRSQNPGSVLQDDAGKPRNSRFMIHPEGIFRRVWDFIICLLLCYLAIMGPFILGWSSAFTETGDALKDIMDTVIYFTFIADIFLNFRTGIIQDGCLIMDWRKVAMHYMKGFLLIDLFSSVPFEKMENIKLLKMAKVARLTKVMKSTGKTGKLTDIFEDMLIVTGLQVLLRPCGILFYMGLVCHWLACFLKISGGEALIQYQDVSQSAAREYLAALYWAMTTMTTVGYGDVIPQTDVERIYAMVAMVIGGSFYGYVIGSISSMVSNRDVNHAAYTERMDKLQAWLSHHSFPEALRRRVRKYLKSQLQGKSAMNEEDIMADLSPDLREEVGSFLIHPDILNNPLFDDLSAGVLAVFLHLLQRVTAETNEVLCKNGAPGTAMFVVTTGVCKLHRPAGNLNKEISMVLCEGDSFGEEIVLQLVESYAYSVVAQTDMNLYMIPESGFIDCFSNMPDVVQIMKRNLASFRSAAGV